MRSCPPDVVEVRIWSARWVVWHAARQSGSIPVGDPLLFRVESICMDVQNFMRSHTERWWPTDELVAAPDDSEHGAAQMLADGVFPQARRDDDRLLVEWKRGHATLFAFDPLPVV